MKACFFDLDGTLLDTLADIGGACNAVLAAHGYPVHPVSAYRRMVGNGFPILMRRALPESVVAQGPQERLDALTEEGRRYYAAHLSIRTTPYPGLVAALGRLQDAGWPYSPTSRKTLPVPWSRCTFPASVSTRCAAAVMTPPSSPTPRSFCRWLPPWAWPRRTAPMWATATWT